MKARTLKSVVLGTVCCVAIANVARAESKVASIDAPSTTDDKAEAPPPEQDKPAALTAPPPSLADSHKQERTANNAIYAEGLGAGLFYSINYERVFGDFSGRVGFGYVSIGATATASNGTTGASASAAFMAIPLTVSYLGIGSKTHMFEVGAGATILNVGEGGSAFDAKSSSSSSGSQTLVLGDVITGYRLQPPDGGFFLRAGLNTILGGSELPVLPWPYLALGGTF
jgi:hypothetical protein